MASGDNVVQYLKKQPASVGKAKSKDHILMPYIKLKIVLSSIGRTYSLG
jgi:hypothetical protein